MHALLLLLLLLLFAAAAGVPLAPRGDSSRIFYDELGGPPELLLVELRCAQRVHQSICVHMDEQLDATAQRSWQVRKVEWFAGTSHLHTTQQPAPAAGMHYCW